MRPTDSEINEDLRRWFGFDLDDWAANVNGVLSDEQLQRRRWKQIGRFLFIFLSGAAFAVPGLLIFTAWETGGGDAPYIGVTFIGIGLVLMWDAVRKLRHAWREDGGSIQAYQGPILLEAGTNAGLPGPGYHLRIDGKRFDLFDEGEGGRRYGYLRENGRGVFRLHILGEKTIISLQQISETEA